MPESGVKTNKQNILDFVRVFKIRSLSVNLKLKLGLLIASLLSVLFVLLISFSVYKKYVKESVYKNLDVIKTSKKNHLEHYFNNTSSYITSLSDNSMICDAVSDFSESFELIKPEVIYSDSTGERYDLYEKDIKNYYSTIYIPELNKRYDIQTSLSLLWPEQKAVQYLQSIYVSGNKFKEKHLLINTNENTSYNNSHEKYHQYFIKILKKLNFEDIYLVNIEGDVVYSSSKKMDFATNLLYGPYKKSGLAKAYLSSIKTELIDFIELVDFSRYLPSKGEHSAFFSTPVFKDDRKIGVIIFQISPNIIEKLLSNNSKADNLNMGKSGELYILGDDMLLRTNPRSFKEDTANYILCLRKRGYERAKVDLIEKTKTSILLQEVKTYVAFEALQGINGNLLSIDYFGRKVFSSYSPLNIQGVNWALIVQKDSKEALKPFRRIVKISLISTIVILFFVMLFGQRFFIVLSNRISRIRESIDTLSKGENLENLTSKSTDEIGQTTFSLNHLAERIKEASDFASKVGTGDFSSEFNVYSENDKLGVSLTQMKDSLQHAAEEQSKLAAEEEKRNWAARGIANFSEILRGDNNNIEELSGNIISNIIDYIDANQGGIYILEERENAPDILSLKSAYAFNKKKFLERTFEVGEGLVGTCAIEKKKIYLKDIPDDYLNISTGLGNTKPISILLLPLKIEEEVLGVLEVASLNEIAVHEIEFLEEVAEIVASTLSTVKMNTRTALLLEESKKRTQDIEQQEEELRQNMEELQATQEEISRLSEDSISFVEGIDKMFIRADIDLDGNFIFANTKFLQETGYELSELKEQSVQKIIEESYRKDFISKFEKLVKGSGRYEKKIILITKKGKELEFRVSMVALKNRIKEISKILIVGVHI